MHCAESFFRAIGGVLNGCRIRDVTDDSENLGICRFEFRDRFFKGATFDICEDQLHASFGEMTRHAKTNSTSPARDEGHLAFEIFHSTLPFDHVVPYRAIQKIDFEAGDSHSSNHFSPLNFDEIDTAEAVKSITPSFCRRRLRLESVDCGG